MADDETKGSSSTVQETQSSSIETQSRKVVCHNVNYHWGAQQWRKELGRIGVTFKYSAKGPKMNSATVKFENEESLKANLPLLEALWDVEVVDVDQPAKKRQKLAEQDHRPPVNISDVVTPLWNTPYEGQLQNKQREVVSILRKNIAATKKMNPNIPEWIASRGKKPIPLAVKPSPVLDGYRNKIEFTIGYADGQTTVGFTAGRFADGIIAVAEPKGVKNTPECAVEIASRIQAQLRRDSTLLPYDKVAQAGFWRGVLVRVNRNNDVMISIEINPSGVDEDVIQTQMKGVRDCLSGRYTSFWMRRYTGTSMPSETEVFEHIDGTRVIEETILGLKFGISPGAFFQTNTLGAEVLYTQLGELASIDKDTVVLDLCCGTGAIGLCLAKQAAKVVGIELVASAVDDAIDNAKRNGVDNAQFICGKVEDVLKGAIDKIGDKGRIVVVLDPPRPGVHPSVLKRLRNEPRISQIVYVACAPKTTIATTSALCCQTSKKYTGDPFVPQKAVMIDMFPHTAHVELAIMYER